MAAPELEDGWVRLHPLSPLLTAGRLVLFGVAFSFQAWSDQLVEEGSSFGLDAALRVGGVVIAVGVATLGYAAVAWRYRVYRVGIEVVELRTGVLLRSHRQLPLDRIESVDTLRSLIPRMLGLAEIGVESIGGKGTELRLRYLGWDDAERLRAELDERRARADAPALETSGPPLHVVPPRELILGYVLIPAVPVAIGASIAFVYALVTAGALGLVGYALVAGTTAFGVGVPLALRLEKLWDFRVDDAGDALVISRGLLNLSTQRIVAGRVQSLRVEQPLVWRALGRHRVVVDVAGYRGAEREAARASATLLPIGSADVVRSLIERLELHVDPEQLRYEPVPRAARWRSLRWRGFGVAETPGHLVVRTGVLWRRTSVVPRARIQSSRVTQGPWQRALGLASVHVDTAGSRLRVSTPHRREDEAVALAQRARPT